jgi:hypothetical protein
MFIVVKKNRILIITIVIAIMILLNVGFLNSLFFIILSLFFTASFFRVEFINSVILRLLVGLSSFISINGIISYSLTVLGFQYSLPVFNAVYLVIDLFIYKLLISNNKTDLKINLNSLVANILLYSLMVLGLFCFVNNSLIKSKFNFNKLVKISSQGEDNISHSEMIRFNYENRRQFMIRDRTERSYVHPSLAMYPQGVHSNIAVLMLVVDGLKLNKFKDYDFYIVEWISISSVYAIFTSGLIYISVELIIGKRRLNIFAWCICLGLASILTIFSLTYYISLLRLGFLTHIISLIILMAQLFLLYSVHNIKGARIREVGGYADGAIFLSTILTLGIASTWLFLWPASFLISITSLITLKYKEFRETVGFKGNLLDAFKYYLLKCRIRTIMLEILFLCLTSYQFIGEKLFGGSGSINAKGAINQVDHNTLMFLIVCLLVTLLLIVLDKNRSKLLISLNPSILIVTFTLLILIYQMWSVQEIRYYGFKALFSLFIILPLLADIGLSLTFNGYTKRILASVALSIVILSGFNSAHTILYPGAVYYNSNGQNMSDEYINISESIVHTDSNAVFHGQCLPAYDYLLSRLTNSMSRGLTTDEREFITDYTLFRTDDISDAPNSINRQHVYTDDHCGP